METFRTFKDEHPATDLAQWLQERGVEAQVADTSVSFDPSFSNSGLNKEWAVRIAPEDFSKAGNLLRDYYAAQVDAIPADYYLFEFSDEELMDILKKPDEWGDLDYVLARRYWRSAATG